jgi:hypothetical protein
MFKKALYQACHVEVLNKCSFNTTQALWNDNSEVTANSSIQAKYQRGVNVF